VEDMFSEDNIPRSISKGHFQQGHFFKDEKLGTFRPGDFVKDVLDCYL
jgi:hypothetical protein